MAKQVWKSKLRIFTVLKSKWTTFLNATVCLRPPICTKLTTKWHLWHTFTCAHILTYDTCLDLHPVCAYLSIKVDWNLPNEVQENVTSMHICVKNKCKNTMCTKHCLGQFKVYTVRVRIWTAKLVCTKTCPLVPPFGLKVDWNLPRCAPCDTKTPCVCVFRDKSRLKPAKQVQENVTSMHICVKKHVYTNVHLAV